MVTGGHPDRVCLSDRRADRALLDHHPADSEKDH